jgi:hypothetical protein
MSLEKAHTIDEKIGHLAGLMTGVIKSVEDMRSDQKSIRADIVELKEGRKEQNRISRLLLKQYEKQRDFATSLKNSVESYKRDGNSIRDDLEKLGRDGCQRLPEHALDDSNPPLWTFARQKATQAVGWMVQISVIILLIKFSGLFNDTMKDQKVAPVALPSVGGP